MTAYLPRRYRRDSDHTLVSWLGQLTRRWHGKHRAEDRYQPGAAS